MRARRSILLVAAVAALVAPVLLAAPAQAAGPDTTADLTITELQPGIEGGDLRFDVECGDNATAADITYWDVNMIAHGFSVPLDGSQQGSVTMQASDFGSPGEVFDFGLLCSDLPVPPGFQQWSPIQTVTLYDSGAAASIPNSTAGSPNSISGTCGTAAADAVSYLAWLDGTTPSGPGDYLFYVTGAPLALDASFAASDLPAAPAAGVYQWVVVCSQGATAAAFRYGSFTVAAGLAVTGDDPVLPMGAALLLLLGGAGLVSVVAVASARRRAHG